jgi:precorrin-6B methylase 1
MIPFFRKDAARMKLPPQETEQEAQWVKDYLVLSVSFHVLEKDLDKMKTAQVVAEQIYRVGIRNIQQAILLDMSRQQEKLKRNGIKIYEQHRSPRDGLRAAYVVRGYHRKVSFLPAFLKAEVLKTLSSYMNVNIQEIEG